MMWPSRRGRVSPGRFGSPTLPAITRYGNDKRRETNVFRRGTKSNAAPSASTAAPRVTAPGLDRRCQPRYAAAGPSVPPNHISMPRTARAAHLAPTDDLGRPIFATPAQRLALRILQAAAIAG